MSLLVYCASSKYVNGKTNIPPATKIFTGPRSARLMQEKRDMKIYCTKPTSVTHTDQQKPSLNTSAFIGVRGVPYL